MEYENYENNMDSGNFYCDWHSILEKVLNGISIEDIWKIEYNSVDKANAFHNMYPKVTRFSVWKDYLNVTRIKLWYLEIGFILEKDIEWTNVFKIENLPGKPKTLSRVGCEAAFCIEFNRKKKWIVTRVYGRV